jgi:hypothetical protein
MIVFLGQGVFSEGMSTMSCFFAATCGILFYFYFFVCPDLRVEDGFVVLAFGLMMDLLP